MFVGRPSQWSNPFEGRSSIGQARATILYRHWLAGTVTAGILRLCRFSEAEIEAMDRRRRAVLRNLGDLAGKRMVCACRPNAAWCHRPVLASFASAAR